MFQAKPVTESAIASAQLTDDGLDSNPLATTSFSSHNSKHPARRLFVGSLAAMTLSVGGGDCNRQSTVQKDLIEASSDCGPRDIFEIFSGDCVSHDDFKEALTLMKADFRFSFVRPIMRVVDDLLEQDESGKDMLDELYDCVDGNRSGFRDGYLTMAEVKYACEKLSGDENALEQSLPQNPNFETSKRFTPKFKNFLKDNWEDLKTLHYYMKLLSAR